MTLSVSGMNNLGFKWHFTQDPMNMNISALNTLLPLSVSDLNSTIPSYLFNLKYMMFKYIKTQTYLQTMTGYPILRPIFFEFPDLDEYYSDNFTSFMYGPAFLVNFPMFDNTPYEFWCELAYLVN